MVKPILKLKMSFIDLKNLFNKMQADNHNVKKSVTTNEKYILRKMGLYFNSLKSIFIQHNILYIFLL